MSEFVIGTGHQRSIRDVLKIVEEQILHTEGIPRKLMARSPSFKAVAWRSDFKGDFEAFSLRIKADDEEVVALKKVAEEYKEHCTLIEEDGAVVVDCPGKSQQSSEDSIKALDKFCQCITLPEVWRGSGDNFRVDRISVELLFQAMIQYKASDVHLSPGSSPVFRIDNHTHPSELMGELSAVQISSMIEEIASDIYWQEFQEHKQTSFNFHQAGLGYSRVSAFTKSGAPHCTFRFLPETIPSFEDLHVPRDTMTTLAELHRGLLLLAGMTGSGKTTTCAALVDYINTNRSAHILTIENPIEYVHKNKKSIISQRTLGPDVESFNTAVTGALRHDPDVIVIGEMRDADTIRSAISAAATGHLVISTLHANTASEVVNRIVSFFDPIERDLVRLQLRDCMQCVICQRLVPKKGGGRVPALEMMLNDVKAIGDGIMVGATDIIRIGMQQTISHSFLFEHYLFEQFTKGIVELEDAREFSTDQSVFDQLRMGTYTVPRLESIKGGH